MVKVKEIAKLDDETIKTIMGLSDYKVVFEANDFEEKETMFLSKKNPEYLHAKFCKVEVSKNAKIPLKREVIYE
jgi:DNA-directed RNA polymerase alpha subunit